jgi:hypothetical protein
MTLRIRQLLCFALVIAVTNVIVWIVASRHTQEDPAETQTQHEVQTQPIPQSSLSAVQERILEESKDDMAIIITYTPYVPTVRPEYNFFLRQGVVTDIRGTPITIWKDMVLRPLPGQRVVVIRLVVCDAGEAPIADLMGSIATFKKAIPDNQRSVLVVAFAP